VLIRYAKVMNASNASPRTIAAVQRIGGESGNASTAG